MPLFLFFTLKGFGSFGKPVTLKRILGFCDGYTFKKLYIFLDKKGEGPK